MIFTVITTDRNLFPGSCRFEITDNVLCNLDISFESRYTYKHRRDLVVDSCSNNFEEIIAT